MDGSCHRHPSARRELSTFSAFGYPTADPQQLDLNLTATLLRAKQVDADSAVIHTTARM